MLLGSNVLIYLSAVFIYIADMLDFNILSMLLSRIPKRETFSTCWKHDSSSASYQNSRKHTTIWNAMIAIDPGGTYWLSRLRRRL